MRLDVVIPSLEGRLTSLEPILRLGCARNNVQVRFFVVVDRGGDPPQDLLELAATRADFLVIHSGHNEGASSARNRGVDAGDGEFILFLDDDVVPEADLIDRYVDAIEADGSGAPGFVGVTRFPAANSAFTAGIVASDILTFFDLCGSRPGMAWGVTANLCLRRSALGSLRFSAAFPKAGGGEDIDLCLRMHTPGGPAEPFVSVPDAVVHHDWWPIGRRSYKRFARWAFGDGRLPKLHPQHRYYNFPTLPETLVLLGIAQLISRRAPPLLSVALAALTIELGVDYLKLRRRGRHVSLRASAEGTVVRLSNDLGRLLGNLTRGRPHAICERFDYFCTGESVQSERLVAGTKAALLVVAIKALRPTSP